jgi:Tripartite tricarboxylate transporter family receptor
VAVRPIRFFVPFPAGGSTDVAARVIGEYLSRALGQQIVVEDESDANGNIDLETAARGAADGYTVLVAPDAVSSNPQRIDARHSALPPLLATPWPLFSLGRPIFRPMVHAGADECGSFAPRPSNRIFQVN